jgi:hypothetical protein
VEEPGRRAPDQAPVDLLRAEAAERAHREARGEAVERLDVARLGAGDAGRVRARILATCTG